MVWRLTAPIFNDQGHTTATGEVTAYGDKAELLAVNAKTTR